MSELRIADYADLVVALSVETPLSRDQARQWADWAQRWNIPAYDARKLIDLHLIDGVPVQHLVAVYRAAPAYMLEANSGL